MRTCSLLLFTLLFLSLSRPTHAAVTAGAAPEPQKVVHKVQKLADNVFCIFGQGGNVGLVVTADHAVLIDDQFENLAPALLATVKTVTDKPIKYLVNTHFHGDHTGANRALEKQVVAIVAHANARKRLAEDQAQKEPAQRGGLPELTLGEEDPKVRARLDIHQGGVDLHLVHVQAGHTDGDVLVGIPQAHVMHLGDLFFNHFLPVIDVKHGGSLAGMLGNVEWVLSFLPDDAKLIPGHGPVGTKKDLVRFRDFLKAAEAHVKAHPGKSGKELDASFDHKAWADVQEKKPFFDWPRFFDTAAGKPAF